MHRVFIASSNSYFYIFEDPPPELDVEYTVTSVGTPNSTAYTSLYEPGIACFTRGTRIDTPDGPRAIELLAPGDLVVTLDDGPCPIRWVGRRVIGSPDLRANPRLAPIRVAADAFGPGQPQRDLRFSRQHRLLLDGDGLMAAFGTPEVLAPVHALTEMASVRREHPPFGIEYLHLLFDRHQVIIAEGLATETLLLAKMSREMMTTPAREEIEAIFPGLLSPAGAAMAPARRLVSRGQLMRAGLIAPLARAS